MPLEFQPFFQTPTDDCVLWRYMDLPKFLALLEYSSLHLCRADQFEDLWEGAYNETDRKEPYFNQISPYLKSAKYLHFIHCWHRAPHESAAMWKLYGHEGSNIAIRSNISRLKSSLAKTEEYILGGNVFYVDYSTAPISLGSGFAPYFRKRLSFSYENEFRLVAWKPSQSSDQKYLVPGSPNHHPPILPIKVSVKDLIEAILVSPKSADWYVELLQSLVQKFDLSPNLVSKSSLHEGPLW